MTIQFGSSGSGVLGSAATSQPLYDAMVYQTDTRTVAVDKTGTILSTALKTDKRDDIQIQAALTYLDGLSTSYYRGYKLFINSGAYYVATALTVNYPHSLWGAGNGSTKIYATSLCTDTMISLNPSDNNFGQINYITLQGMELNGSSYCNYGVISKTIGSTSSWTINTHYNDMVITGFIKWGIVDNSNRGSTYTNCVFRSNNTTVTTLPIYTAEAGTDATHIHCPSASLPGTTDGYYNGWYLWNITRGIGAPITDFTAIGKIITVAISGQVNTDTFNIIPNYGNVLIDGTYKPLFTGCVFDAAVNGLVIRKGNGAVFNGCSFCYNRFHGMYAYSYSGTSHPIDMHFDGLHTEYNGRYNVTYADTIGIYDIYIADADSEHFTISDVYARLQTGLTESLHCLGNYTTVLNYHCTSASIGTLGGTDSINVNTMMATADAMLYKGVIACAANPNYPAADAGHMYKVSSAGFIGGAAGIAVAVGDLMICNTDATAAGDHATVGAFWDIVQTNVGMGTATITAAATFVDVTHSFIAVPSNISVTPSDDISGRNYWIDTVGAVTFRINISASDVVDHGFYWTVG
jgi:hypothetical protein